MKKTEIVVALLVGLLALPSIAAPTLVCNKPKEKWMKESDLRRELRRQGYLIGSIRVESGCYELYGLDPRGRRIQILIDPETAKPVTVN